MKIENNFLKAQTISIRSSLTSTARFRLQKERLNNDIYDISVPQDGASYEMRLH